MPGNKAERLGTSRFDQITQLLSAVTQVIFGDSSRHTGPVPSGRGVATHGAPLGDGDIEGVLQDGQGSWRSVLSTGEVTQAYQ